VRLGALLLAALLMTIPAAAQPPPTPAEIQGVRQVYGEALSSERAIPRGLAEVERLRHRSRGAHATATLAAYRGAFTVLRAKHGMWPPDRLRHTRNGLAVLDSVVAANPAHAEARYLRLMSCYYLPRLFGRGWSVREDFAALARLLPSVRGDYPPDLYQAIVRFVMEHGHPSPEQRAALQASLGAADG
jgi:hypothetical protein